MKERLPDPSFVCDACLEWFPRHPRRGLCQACYKRLMRRSKALGGPNLAERAERVEQAGRLTPGPSRRGLDRPGLRAAYAKGASIGELCEMFATSRSSVYRAIKASEVRCTSCKRGLPKGRRGLCRDCARHNLGLDSLAAAPIPDRSCMACGVEVPPGRWRRGLCHACYLRWLRKKAKGNT